MIEFYGGNKEVVAKSVLEEQWDDYQLRSLAFGGNKPFFDLVKDYEISGENIAARHKHKAIKWYRARHIAAMDDMPFHVAKPAAGAGGDSKWEKNQAVAKE